MSTTRQPGDVPVKGGAARPSEAVSSRMTGLWAAVRPDGSVVTGRFGRRWFGSPQEVEQYLTSEAAR